MDCVFIYYNYGNVIWDAAPISFLFILMAVLCLAGIFTL